MLQNYNKYKVLKVFLDSPTEFFGLREICRLVGISPKSVLNYLDEFQKEELIERIEKKGKPFYQARRENENFILYKNKYPMINIPNSRKFKYYQVLQHTHRVGDLQPFVKFLIILLKKEGLRF